MTNQDFGPILQTTFDPSLEIWDFLNKLKKWNNDLVKPWMLSLRRLILNYLAPSNFLERYPKLLSMFSWMWPTTKNTSYTSSNISLAIKSYKNASKWRFLLSFTPLSIWKSNFLSNGLTLLKFSSAFNAPKQWEPPCINLQKNAFCGSCSKRIWIHQKAPSPRLEVTAKKTTRVITRNFVTWKLFPENAINVVHL
jgi:hypothetical protein